MRIRVLADMRGANSFGAEGLSSYSEQAALLLSGCQVVLRGAVPCCMQGQAARRRMTATEKQPGGPVLAACDAVSSLGRVSTYTHSLFLASQAASTGAAYSE